MAHDRRRLGALVAALTLAVSLGACSDDPSTGSGPTDPASPTEQVSSLTAGMPSKKAVRTLVEAYPAAVEAGRTGEATAALRSVATEEWSEELLANYRENVTSQGRVVYGRTKVTIRSVKIRGETATVTTCSDNTGVKVLPEGSDPDRPGPVGVRTISEYSLVRTDQDGWQISGVENQQKSC